MLAWNGKEGANYEANYFLINKLGIKECIIAGAVTKTITLPYNP